MSGSIGVFYSFVSISLIYLLNKNKSRLFFILVILLFFNGLFGFLGKGIQDIYRIALCLFTIYFLFRTRLSQNVIKKNLLLILSFIFFTVSFLYTAYINNDYFNIIFSQYSRYFIIFSLFIILSKFSEDLLFRQYLEVLIGDLILVQVLLTIVKYFTIGLEESYVGSISSIGGAVATSLPLLGFVFLWLKNKGEFKRNDWLQIIGLMFIGFTSYKRAIWFVMPVLIALCMFYIPKRRMPKKILFGSLFLVPLVFYLGVRFNPTLNREGKIGGGFDLNYALEYATTYSFGREDASKKSGRVNAALYLYDKIVSKNITETDWFGYGLRFMYATNYEEFAELDLPITHKGSATGAFQTMVTNGYLGLSATLLFIISILIQIQNKRLKYVMIGLFSWEYFFYTGSILRDSALSFLLIYIVIFSSKDLSYRRVHE